MVAATRCDNGINQQFVVRIEFGSMIFRVGTFLSIGGNNRGNVIVIVQTAYQAFKLGIVVVFIMGISGCIFKIARPDF